MKIGFVQRQMVLRKLKRISCKCEACVHGYSLNADWFTGPKIKIPNPLKRRLRNCPIDITGMWELLKIMNSAIIRPCVEMEILKFAISDAYLGNKYPVSILIRSQFVFLLDPLRVNIASMQYLTCNFFPSNNLHYEILFSFNIVAMKEDSKNPFIIFFVDISST